MKQILVRYINIILGAIVAAFALEEFLVPANILDGGIVGTSIIISSITPISLSILTVCLNLPFVLVGAKQLEKSFLPRTIVAMGVFSLFLEIFNRWHYDATYDALLATVFGGLILGAGVGLIIRNGGCLDGCTIDFSRAEVHKGSEIISLTAKEHTLLETLARNAGKIVTVDALCEALWGDNPFGYENSLNAHVRRVREKIETDPSKPVSLITIKGLGYKLIARK